MIKLYYFFFFFLVSICYCSGQEIKFFDAYGKPLDKKTVVIHGLKQDTINTNKKGIIRLKKKQSFDSISIIKIDTILETKSKTDLINKEFRLLLSPTNSLPVFETNTAKYSQVITALKEIHHESISNDEIYNSNASSGAELLLLTDGVTIQKSQAGGGSPIIRGFEANRVLLMIDGVRMNNAIYRSGHVQNSLTVDPFVVENCDVIYGSSAVSYGSDAIGGVIHYKTVDPKLSESNKTVTRSTNYFNRLNSGSEEITHHLNFNIGIKKWASFSSATYKQYGNIKMGENRSHGFNDWGKVYHSIINYNDTDSVVANTNQSLQKGLGYEQVDLTQKLLYQPTKNLSFMFNSQLSSSSNISRFDQLNNIGISGPQFSQWEYGPQKRWMNSLKINYSPTKKIFDQLTILLSRQDIEESRITRKFNTPLQQNNIENVSVLGVSIQATKKLGLFSSINYGAELYQNTVKSDGYKIDIYSGNISSINTRYPDRGSNLTMNGFYAIYNLQKDRFSIVSGIRYTFNKVNGNFTANSTQLIFPEIKLQNNSLNGSFNLSYYPHQRTKITFDLSSGFKSPNVDDLGKVFTKDGFITLPNNNLSPEYSYCGAIGWNQKFYLLSNRLKLHFNNSAYVTLLEDVIVKKEFEMNGSYQLLYNSNWYEILANQNSGSALIYGFSSSFDLSILEKIRLHSGLTYTKGLIIKDNIPFGHIPPLIGNFSIRYSQKDWNYSIFTVYNSYKKIEDFGQGNVDNPNEATLRGFPDWWTLNGKVSYQLNKKLRILIGCYNILDFHYKTFASGISSPGRNFMVSFKLSY